MTHAEHCFWIIVYGIVLGLMLYYMVLFIQEVLIRHYTRHHHVDRLSRPPLTLEGVKEKYPSEVPVSILKELEKELAKHELYENASQIRDMIKEQQERHIKWRTTN